MHQESCPASCFLKTPFEENEMISLHSQLCEFVDSAQPREYRLNRWGHCESVGFMAYFALISGDANAVEAGFEALLTKGGTNVNAIGKYYESWSFDPWVLRRIESLGEQYDSPIVTEFALAAADQEFRQEAENRLWQASQVVRSIFHSAAPAEEIIRLLFRVISVPGKTFGPLIPELIDDVQELLNNLRPPSARLHMLYRDATNEAQGVSSTLIQLNSVVQLRALVTEKWNDVFKQQATYVKCGWNDIENALVRLILHWPLSSTFALT